MAIQRVENTGKTALITGAASGIGWELANIHASRGDDLILVARRKERLISLKNGLENEYGITVYVIVQDLSEQQAAETLYSKLKEKELKVDYLINNAGFGGHGLFHERPWKSDEAMIQVNVMALAHLTRLIVDDMVKRKEGKIMNVASMAGFAPGPLQAVYYATKAFVVSFSEAINNELKSSNVTVTVLCPGPTETEFFEVANTKGTRAFSRKSASAYDVALDGYNGMMSGKTMVIPGVVNKFLLFATKVTPRFLATKISRMMMEKEKTF